MKHALAESHGGRYVSKCRISYACQRVTSQCAKWMAGSHSEGLAADCIQERKRNKIVVRDILSAVRLFRLKDLLPEPVLYFRILGKTPKY